MDKKKYDLNSVQVQFIDASNGNNVLVALESLKSATAVAIDTETVYNESDDLITHTLPSGEEGTYKRNLNVDGPGMWRVMSIAARFGTVEDAQYLCWVLDMKDADFAAVNKALSGVKPYGWNASFDRGVLERDGVHVRNWWDAMLMDAVVRAGSNGSDTSRYSSLAAATNRELGIDLDGKSTTRLSYDADTELTADQVTYAANDAIVTLWVGDVIGARARSFDLTNTVVRECAANPLIDQMTRAGLPIDVQAYTEQVIEPARTAAANAAERLAILTTGREFLETATKWADFQGIKLSSSDQVEAGLEVLRSEDYFPRFIADTRDASTKAKAKAAVAFGGSTGGEDLFSEGPAISSPFNLDDENEIRRYLSKQSPLFAAAVVATTLDSDLTLEQAQNLAISDQPALEKACAGKKRLVKAHDLDSLVLPALATSPISEVTSGVKEGVAALAAYRRYQAILASYGHLVAPVRLRPDWKVSAADSVKAMLNEFSKKEVQSHFKRAEGKPRLLTKSDSVDHDTLVLIGGPISETLLEFRKNEKMLTTYGDDFLKFVHPVTGRIHARYSQALTGTGRLSSSSPNAQNLPPAAKKFLRPPMENGKIKRVLVAADLSQAELRYVADQSEDDLMLSAFAAGEDLHTRTASLMFDMDLVALKTFDATIISDIDITSVKGLESFKERFCSGTTPKVDPSRTAASLHKELRQKAKSVAFGYAYGLKGGSLSQQLTVSGVDTTKEEADELLALFDTAYPAVASWMGARVSVVSDFSSSVMNGEANVDFESSWRLHGMYPKVTAAVTSLKAKLGYTPDDNEVSQQLVSDEEIAARSVVSGVSASDERARVTESVSWVRSFEYPVVLTHEGEAWMFSSRTAGGRVRWFPVLTRDWEMGMVSQIIRSRDSSVVAARDAWVKDYNARMDVDVAADKAAGKVRRAPTYVRLYKAGGSASRPRALWGKELDKQFEDRARRTDFVLYILAASPSSTRKVMRLGMSDRVRAATNQYRNHPVQGGVADAMLVAMANVDTDLQNSFPSARAIQSVHDSLVVECDVQDASAIRELMVRHMEQGLNDFCPSVKALADADVQLSLDDKTILSDLELTELIVQAA